MEIDKLNIEIGETYHGWSDVRISIKDKEFKIQASYLGDHPISGLINAVFNAWLYFSSMGGFDKLEESEILFQDEPRGLKLVISHFESINENQKFNDYTLDLKILSSEDSFRGDKDKIEWKELLIGKILLIDLVRETIRNFKQIIKLHGFLGLRNKWHLGSAWENDYFPSMIDIEKVLALNSLLKDPEAYMAYADTAKEEAEFFREIYE